MDALNAEKRVTERPTVLKVEMAKRKAAASNVAKRVTEGPIVLKAEEKRKVASVAAKKITKPKIVKMSPKLVKLSRKMEPKLKSIFRL